MSTFSAARLASEHEYKTKVYSNIEALEILQTMPSRLLGQFIKGEINLKEIAKLEMSNRGQDTEGRWIGFNEAEKYYENLI